MATAQQEWREAFEAAPLTMLDRRRDEDVDHAREVVAEFVGATVDELVFVSNASSGVTAVLRSIDWGSGDSIVATNHGYNAVTQSLFWVCEHAGAEVRCVDLPCPIDDPDLVVDRIIAAIDETTRLVVVDHVTSPSALVLPVERIIAAARERGVGILIDGAHAPGMLNLNVNDLGADYYVGNLHKWVSAPVGAAFLVASGDAADRVAPPTLSHFIHDGLARAFSYQGTRDISPCLCAPVAVKWFDRFGWESVRGHNEAMATWAGELLSQRWDTEAMNQAGPQMQGSMATIALPGCPQEIWAEAWDCVAELYEKDRVELAVMELDGRWWARVSAHIYNTAEDYERVADAVLRRCHRS